MDGFDLVCGETNVSLLGKERLEHDMLLSREGKLMQTIIQNVTMDLEESLS